MTANSHSIELSALVAEHLERAQPDLLRSMLSSFIQALMSAEADAVCGAPYGVRSAERANSRNGYRVRDFDTRAGTVEVAIPKLREGSYFPEWLLERRKRAERALVSVVATSYLLGVSTRRMERLVETLGITRLSKSQVSVMARELDEVVADFRSRPLDQGPYTFLAADALTMKVREGGPGRTSARTDRDWSQRRRAPRGPRHRRHFRRRRRRLADVLPRPGRPRPVRGLPGHLRCPHQPGRRVRGGAPRRLLAALPHPLRREPDGRHTEGLLGLGESAAALGL